VFASSWRKRETWRVATAKNTKTEKEKHMSAVSIIDSVNSNLVARESKTGATTWKAMSRKSFSLTLEAQGLKGRALKKAHWQYLQRTSSELNSAVSSEIAAGRIFVTSVSANSKGTGGTVKFETADHFARHEVGEIAKKLNETDALKMLSEKYGVDVAALVASLKK
jgi:hypothetical protein